MIAKPEEAALDKYGTPTRQGSVFVRRTMGSNTWPVPTEAAAAARLLGPVVTATRFLNSLSD